MKWLPVPMHPNVTRSEGAVHPRPSTLGGTTIGAADAASIALRNVLRVCAIPALLFFGRLAYGLRARCQIC
jgi:hypothetical protein